jgi:hypothetical protein
MAFDNESPRFPEGLDSTRPRIEFHVSMNHDGSMGPIESRTTAIGGTEYPTYLSQEQCPALFDPLSNQDAFPIVHPINYCLLPGCRSIQKDFLTSNDLDFHIQTHHIRSCPWPTCNIQRSFLRKSDLLSHMESVHSGTRRFMCEFSGCCKTYSRKDNLTAHKRSHVQDTCPDGHGQQNVLLTAVYHQLALIASGALDSNSESSSSSISRE